MKKAAMLIALSLCAPGSESAAADQDKDKVRIFASGVFSVGSLDFSQSRTFKQYAEDGQVESQYSANRGLGFELGLHYRIKGRLGAAASVSSVSRDSSLSYTAKVPHPLFLDRAREVSGTEDGLSYRETAVHVDFVYAIRKGSVEILLFGGPSYMSVKTDLLGTLTYQEAYPYDQVTVSAVTLSEGSNSAFGFNLGAGLDYRFGKSFGLGAQARYTIATATLAPAEGPTIDLKVGGFQAAVGLRIFF